MKRMRTSNLICAMAGMSLLLLCACHAGENVGDITMSETPETVTVVEATESLESESFLDTAEESTEEGLETTETLTQASEEETETDPYAGIDMNSTLPGAEWILGFNNIIDQPKLVVFNDTTNKKVILENNQEVEFADDDTLAVYMPQNDGEVTRYLLFEEVSYSECVTMFRKMPKVIKRDGYVCPICITITFEGEERILNANLKLIG